MAWRLCIVCDLVQSDLLVGLIRHDQFWNGGSNSIEWEILSLGGRQVLTFIPTESSPKDNEADNAPEKCQYTPFSPCMVAR
jgi:hypothetical protein